MSTSSSKALALVALALVAVAAEPGAARKRKADPEYAPTFSTPMPAPPANGAIFQAANGYAPLTSGGRAAMVGDILTIVLTERTQASKSNAAKTDRSGDVGINPPTTGILSKIAKSTSLSASGSQGFDGKGEASQSNQLNGEITVTVAQVFPNGTMMVRGEKMLTLNRGDENIQISGLVRPEDISADNRIASTRVANARITYSGKGEIARASRQGWLQRFFSMLSPF